MKSFWNRVVPIHVRKRVGDLFDIRRPDGDPIAILSIPFGGFWNEKFGVILLIGWGCSSSFFFARAN
jgi:hypothetical protein